jgi:nicotinate-nucleotide adenylyltransferase
MKTNHIAILGSSFNPPHNGHVAVIQDLVKNHKYDAIWLMPVFSHPFGKKLAPYDDRLAMIKLLLKGLTSPKISLCQAEKDLGKSPSYTIDVMEYLRSLNPNTHFSLVLGTDIKQDLYKWHRINDLQRLVDFVFIPRQGFEASPYPEVSSTQLRRHLAKGEDISMLMPKTIADYARSKNLYTEQ